MSSLVESLPWKERPILVLTSDIDWASEDCISDLFETAETYGIHPTAFITHESLEISRRQSAGRLDVGLHPNFLPGSDHGGSVDSVIEHVFSLAPAARCFRSHVMIDSTPISIAMKERGILYDSNLALYLQRHLVPLEHWSGIPRFPIFWGDDIHYRREGRWSFDDYDSLFFSPGLKILSVHPFFFALNVPNHDFYLACKKHIPTLSAKSMVNMRFSGSGIRTFVLEIFEAAKRRHVPFYSLEDVYQSYARMEWS